MEALHCYVPPLLIPILIDNIVFAKPLVRIMEDSNKSLGFVESLLLNATPDNFKSTEVEKPLDLEYDIGNLTSCDSNILDSNKLKSNKESYLKELARDDTQLLINKIWQLPTNRVEDVVVVKLPTGTTLLPREKLPPKAKPPTKWEQYAKEKGIQKRKKDKLVWDETQKDWRPRYGYKRVKNEKDDWVLEVPQNADPNTDMFAKKKEKKTERIAKNEFQRLRNLSKNKNLKVPNQGLVPLAAPSKDHVNKAITIAKTSTASIGKFTDKLPEEKVAKNVGKKRKFESNLGDISKEKAKSLKILENLHNKEPKLDVKAAVNQLTHQEEKTQAQANQSTEGRKGKGSQKTRGKKGSEKGKGGKRKFNPAGKNSKAAKRNMGKRKRGKA